MSRDRLAAARVSSIQQDIERVNANVHQIATLHARILNVIDHGESQDVAQLEQISGETRTLSNRLKDRIKTLERAPAGPDAKIRKNQTGLVREKFLDAIRNYQRVEQDYRKKSEERVERQLKIVKPDASPEEVKAVVGGGGQQIFAQALSSTSRYGESRMAFREVQERQTELRKMEQTIAELAQLFSDDETIGDIENIAGHVEEDTRAG
ncbi:hypothetical protein H0H87_000087 [Tephrocybe sp. NHM501043]|nr:hypothetical protein H0H87_000087 [Tephrocybe sp. NHM501043]